MSEQNTNTKKHFDPKFLLLIGLPVLLLAVIFFLPGRNAPAETAASSSPVIGTWYADNSTRGQVPMEIRSDGTATTFLGLTGNWNLQGTTLTITCSTVEGRTETYTYDPETDTLSWLTGTTFFRSSDEALASYQNQWGDLISSDTDGSTDTRRFPAFHYYGYGDLAWTIDMTGPGAKLFKDGELVEEFSADTWTWHQTQYDMTLEGHPSADQTIYIIFGETFAADVNGDGGWFIAVRGLPEDAPTMYTSTALTAGNY